MADVHDSRCCDIAVVGAGAAGFAAAIAAAASGATVVLFNSHRRVGLKILMSGGTRCNVTHDQVSAASFHGSSRHAVNLVLKAFGAGQTRAWFEEMGVSFKIEPGGKLFPVTDSAETVLEALIRRARELGVMIRTGVRVTAVAVAGPAGAGSPFTIETSAGSWRTASVILTTGGLSYPKTGSDGSGYDLARGLGHSIARLTPALTPLLLEGDLHRILRGVTLPAALTLRRGGKPIVTCAGSLLFTHFGLSGPAALDMSRHWIRQEPGDEPARLTAHFLPGPARPIEEGGGLLDPERAERPGGLPDRGELETDWLEAAGREGRTTVQSHFASKLPLRLVRELARAAQVEPAAPLAQVSREARRRFLETVVACPLPVTGVVGYRKAEVTAGGVPLHEVDPRRMASRLVPGLFLAGEILDVDGRLGGYNFQWAWSSGHVAGEAAARWVRMSAADPGD